MRVSTVPERDLPAVADNCLYLDYIAGEGQAASFYAHGPLDFAAVLAERRAYSFPRQEVVPLLAEYNASLGAGAKCLHNVEALRDPTTFCVIGGQQVGFLGGPVYTAYKIMNVIRLAQRLQDELGVRVVPLLWLASEDHDFYEINFLHYVKGDGEIGRVSFSWDKVGHPIARLEVHEGVQRAFAEYFDCLTPGPHRESVRTLFAPRGGESYSTWHTRLWCDLFSQHGLVLVEPWVLRPAAGDFFRFALEHSQEIDARLEDVSRRLLEAGYQPLLTAGQAGHLFALDDQGRRLRVGNPGGCWSQVAECCPERLSTDAALRPLLADAMLPVLGDVLGAGEIAYQAMLKPLHELFGVPQPVLFPRKHYTVVGPHEAKLLRRYCITAEEVLTGRLRPAEAWQRIVTRSEAEPFAAARAAVREALSPLKPQVERVDPSLGRTWVGALTQCLRALDKLEERTERARLSQLGYARRHLRALTNLLLPKGRLQERMLPLPHFLSRHGMGFLDSVFPAGDLYDFSHCILMLEDDYA